ncbi:MAG: 1-acyl-sn-glycerol-3-phosphate acyltransferase [Acidobacteriota bacterium]
MTTLPRSYRALRWVFRRIVGIFFRQVRVTGVRHIPAEGGGLMIAWHPNALVDPGLMMTHFPRRIVFGARHGLFKIPLLGSLMRSVGTVPIYRKMDAKGESGETVRREANRKSLDALAGAVANGSFAALFPEGQSHDEPDVQELKAGAASLYYRACELTPENMPKPVILPVGLHYDDKGVFGSNALVSFHPPVELPPDLAEPPAAADPKEARRQKYAGLTEELDRILREVVLGTESWELHHMMHRARKLVRAERAARAGAALGRPDIEERVLGFARFWTGYQSRVETHPEETRQLMERLQHHDEELTALHLEDHELDRSLHLRTLRRPAKLFLQALLVYLLLPSLVIIGYLVNTPTALAIIGLAKLNAKAYKDEASFKMLVGALAFPLTWLVVALLVGWGQSLLHAAYPVIPEAPVLSGIVALFISAISGLVALIYLRLVRSTARAIRVRLTRARSERAIQRLRRERSEIFEQVMELAAGLDLPGSVAEDGRIVRDGGVV